jgi:hypothetical protein
MSSKFNVTAFPVKLVNNTVDQLFGQIWRATIENSGPERATIENSGPDSFRI